MKESEKLSMGIDGTAAQIDTVQSQLDADEQRSSWLTAEEAAKHLKVRTRTLLLWARQGKVKGYVLSGPRRHLWRFRRVDLDATLELPSVRPERMVQ
jgi:excisionase family DNA binding protein